MSTELEKRAAWRAVGFLTIGAVLVVFGQGVYWFLFRDSAAEILNVTRAPEVIMDDFFPFGAYVCNDPGKDPGSVWAARRAALSADSSLPGRNPQTTSPTGAAGLAPRTVFDAFGFHAIANNEAHDCQRLIQRDNKKKNPLVTFWLSTAVPSITDYSSKRLVGGFSWQDGDKFDEYKLEKAESCVWVQKVGVTWKAWIVPHEDAEKCDPANPNEANGKELTVFTKDQDTNQEYPYAARIIDKGSFYLFGFQCLRHTWCVIGAERDPGGPYDGRGDFQRLHYADAGKVLHTSFLEGTIEPMPFTTSLPDEATFHNVWIPLAKITITGSDDPARIRYAEKWGYPVGAKIPDLVVVEIMKRTTDNKWLMRFGQQGTGKVIKPDPKSGHHYGTVRWRWSDVDEGVWVPCPAGCCGDE